MGRIKRWAFFEFGLYFGQCGCRSLLQLIASTCSISYTMDGRTAPQSRSIASCACDYLCLLAALKSSTLLFVDAFVASDSECIRTFPVRSVSELTLVNLLS